MRGIFAFAALLAFVGTALAQFPAFADYNCPASTSINLNVDASRETSRSGVASQQACDALCVGDCFMSSVRARCVDEPDEASSSSADCAFRTTPPLAP